MDFNNKDDDKFLRTRMLIGDEAVNKLKNSHIAIFGVGGVGSYVVEALARANVLEFSLYDSDIVSISNINRQSIATTKTIGEQKVEVAKRRIQEINPAAIVHCYPVFYTQDNANNYPLTAYNYVVDAIDTVSAKILLVELCHKDNIPIISSMGTGNKLDPTRFMITDIKKTSVCPLAKVMRHELKKRGIKKLKVLFSTEEPRIPFVIEKSNDENSISGNAKRQTPASISFVPSVAGLIIAGEVIKDICSL